MGQRQQGGPGSSGSSDIETGKPQDSRENRYPGEGNASKDSPQMQQGGSGDKQYGEGNYAASRDYNERTKQFVESGRVEQAAKDAAPKNEREAKEMKEAEREGRRPMREEDPEINPDKDKMPGQGPDAGQ
jgi:hypothetical protein